MANVIFKQGTRAQYDAIAVKDVNTLYWLTDTQELFKGEALYGKGAEATALASGLMSAADKAKLDNLAAGTVEFTIEEQETATNGFDKTYKLRRTDGENITYVGDAINIPKYAVLSGGTYEIVETADVPYAGAEVGDPYVDLVVANTDESHIYVPLKGLVDTVKAGLGVKVENNTVSIKLDEANTNGLSVTEDGVALGLATNEHAGAMSAVDKVALDTLSTDMAKVKADIEQLKSDGVAGGIAWENI